MARVIEVVADRRLAHQPGTVRHQLPQSDWRVERIRRLEVRQVPRDGRVEVELSTLDELHDSDVGEQLGHGADAIHGLGRGWLLLRRIGIAEPPGPDHLLVLDQRDRDRRKPLVFDLVRNQALDLRDRGGIALRNACALPFARVTLNLRRTAGCKDA